MYQHDTLRCRSLGQNFLTDDTILADIVAASRITSNDLVLEVGPGTGNLTRHLVATGALVTAVEKDDTLYDKLQVQFAQVGTMFLHL
jgi:16S rRNA (adenine1518-N6/adenine1519-N6)-dimethyltransferase